MISIFLGLTILGRYQNYYYIMNTIVGFLQVITSSIVTAIGNNVAIKSQNENLNQFKIFHFGYNWIASWCTICLLCLYQPFMKIWVGEDNMFSFAMVIIMCVYFYSLKVGDVVSLYKEATGIYWEDRIRPITESVANLVLNILFVKLWGVYGVALATIINIPWSTMILFKIYFKQSPKVYFSAVFKYLLILLFGAVVTYCVCSMIKINTILDFGLKVIICIIVPNIIFGFYAKSTDTGQYFISICKKVLRR